MLETIFPAIKLTIEQAPNMLFAVLVFVYLARQNNAVLDTMRAINERQFELIQKLCSQCLNDQDQSPS
jgi:hypothetical protein